MVDPITKALKLYDELVYLDERLKEVTKELATESDYSKHEKLFALEFKLLIKIAGAHEDLILYLAQVDNPEHRFVVNRLRKDAHKIYNPIVIGGDGGKRK